MKSTVGAVLATLIPSREAGGLNSASEVAVATFSPPGNAGGYETSAALSGRLVNAAQITIKEISLMATSEILSLKTSVTQNRLKLMI